MNQSDIDKSNVFFILRGFAIWSVVYAHSINLQNNHLSDLGSLLGLIGVPLFLLCSGYYFKNQPWPEFWRKKFKSLLCPWIIWGTFAYAVSCFLGASNLSLLKYLSYLLGYNTWLYYVPVYFTILLVYNTLKVKYMDFALIIISILSIVSTYVFQLHTIGGFMTFYQNPLNFIVFFSLGRILRQNDLLERMQSRVILFMACIVLIFTMSYFFLTDDIIRYVNPVALLFELSFVVILFRVASFVKNSKVMTYLGRNSYIIYFLHMQIGIALANRILIMLNVTNDYILFVFKPVLVVIITIVTVQILNLFIKLLNLTNYRQIFGLAR
jgi:fucose 4-O-acetylase-like acetyltransferase